MTTNDGIKSSRIELERVAASETDQAYIKMKDPTDTFGYYSNPGSPEGIVFADIGSVCSDTTNGNFYVKETDTVNTGWVQLKKLISAFDAFVGTTLTNVTGDGTVVFPLIYDAETFDLNGDYDITTGIFTAPVAGLYYFNVEILWDGLTAAHNDGTAQIAFATVADTQIGLNVGVVRRPGTAYAQTFSTVVQLPALETVQIATTVSGGALVVDLPGGTPALNPNQFSGFLIA